MLLLSLDPSGHRFITETTATDINWKAAYASKDQPTIIASSPNNTPRPYHTRQNRASLGELPRRKKNELSPVVEKRTWNGLTSSPLEENPGFDVVSDPDCPPLGPDTVGSNSYSYRTGR